MHIFRTISALALLAIGLLWSWQGADPVPTPPMACVANGAPVAGGSVAWLIGGLVAVSFGP